MTGQGQAQLAALSRRTGLSLTVVAAVAFADTVVLVVIVTIVDDVLAVFAVAVVNGFRLRISVSAATVRGTPSLLRAGHYSFLALAKLESLNSPDGLDRNCLVTRRNRRRCR